MRWALASIVVAACGTPAKTLEPPACPQAEAPEARAAAPADEVVVSEPRLTYERPFVSTCWRDEEIEEAGDAVEALAGRVAALKDTADASPLYYDLLRVLENPCFALAEGEGVPRRPSNGLAMKTWWRDGGELWLRNYVAMAAGDATAVIVPPTMRKTLTPRTNPKHRLVPWMCPPAEPDCVDETDRAFASDFVDTMILDGSGLGRLSMAQGDTEGTKIEFNWGACDQTAALADDEHQYAAFRECTELATPRHWALPVGGFRSPTEGWFIVQGRRGHYSYCDRLDMFHLESGATYRAEICGGIVCAESDERCKTKPLKTTVGNVDAATVRKTLWAAMWGPESEIGVVPRSRAYVMPAQLDLRRPGRPELRMSAVERWGSGHTVLTWSYGHGKKHGFDGKLGWPSAGGNGGGEYAVERLRELEATFEAGCPKAKFPDVPLYARAYGVSVIDAHPAEVASTQQKLIDGLRKASAKACK